MSYLLRVQNYVNFVVLCQVIIQKCRYFGYVPRLHGPHSCYLVLFWQSMHLVKCWLTFTWRFVAKAYLHSFWRVEISVPVCCRSKRSRQRSPTRIDSLPNIALVNSTCHFFNQYGCESVRSKLFVYTQEVYFCHDYILTECPHMYRNTRYKSEQSFLIASSNSNQPIRLRPRWSKGPCQKLNTVVKPKIPAIILNVVIA